MNDDDRLRDLDPSAFSALIHGEWPIPEPPHHDLFRHALEADAASFGVVTHRRFFEPYPWCMADDLCDGVPSSEPSPIRRRPFQPGDGPGCGQKCFLFVCDCWRESGDCDRLFESLHTTGFDPDAFPIPAVRMRMKEYASPGRPDRRSGFSIGTPPSGHFRICDRPRFLRVEVWIGQCPVCWTVFWAVDEQPR